MGGDNDRGPAERLLEMWKQSESIEMEFGKKLGGDWQSRDL